MAYNSPYTGAEIDAAITAVKNGVYAHYITFNGLMTESDFNGSMVLINSNNTPITTFETLYQNLGNGNHDHFPCNGEAWGDSVIQNHVSIMISAYTENNIIYINVSSNKPTLAITKNGDAQGRNKFEVILDTVVKVL